MVVTDIRDIYSDLYDALDETCHFERIRRRKDGRMPVASAGAAHRSARRQETWRRLGRQANWLTES